MTAIKFHCCGVRVESHFLSYLIHRRVSAIKSYVHFHHFTGEPKFQESRMRTNNFLCEPVKINVHIHLLFNSFDLIKSINFFSRIF